MGDYLDTYSKFLIGNFDFFSEMVDKLLCQPKVNKELILKIQRRLKVLKLIDSVSESLEKYFYGNEYKQILENSVFDDLEYFIEYLLRYRKREIKLNVIGEVEKNLEEICSNSYASIHNYKCSDNVQLNINSDEIFLEDYDEIAELYFILDEIACMNINFKVIDVEKDEEYFEDRINSRKYKNYVNTKITLLKIRDYNNFIRKTDTNEFILNRMSLIDPNPIWKYYLLMLKIQSKELPQTIINYASYIKDNSKDYSYLDEELYYFMNLHSLFVLCESYIELNDYSKFDEYFEELEKEECNLLELIYLKGKKILKNNDFEVDKFLKYVESELSNRSDKKSIINGTSQQIYSILGRMLLGRGNYIGAAQNYLESGEITSYANGIGHAFQDIVNGLYSGNDYSKGMLITSKINSDYDFISDEYNPVNINDINSRDYNRFFTLELCAKEIRDKNVLGNVAELGVFKGDFSKLLNKVFNDKKLYLFDTCSSFDKFNVEFEKLNGIIEENVLNEIIENHKSTDIDMVLEKLQDKDKVIVKQGDLQESLENSEERFCFVSLDVKLYKATLEGLNYFYNRLSPGGYIFVRDYNSKLYKGVSAAVNDFEKIIGHKLLKFPLCDLGGTLVITK